MRIKSLLHPSLRARFFFGFWKSEFLLYFYWFYGCFLPFFFLLSISRVDNIFSPTSPKFTIFFTNPLLFYSFLFFSTSISFSLLISIFPQRDHTRRRLILITTSSFFSRSSHISYTYQTHFFFVLVIRYTHPHLHDVTTTTTTPPMPTMYMYYALFTMSMSVRPLPTISHFDGLILFIITMLRRLRLGACSSFLFDSFLFSLPVSIYRRTTYIYLRISE